MTHQLDGVEDALKSNRHYVQELGETILNHIEEKWTSTLETFKIMEEKAGEFKENIDKVRAEWWPSG